MTGLLDRPLRLRDLELSGLSVVVCGDAARLRSFLTAVPHIHMQPERLPPTIAPSSHALQAIVPRQLWSSAPPASIMRGVSTAVEMVTALPAIALRNR